MGHWHVERDIRREKEKRREGEKETVPAVGFRNHKAISNYIPIPGMSCVLFPNISSNCQPRF